MSSQGIGSLEVAYAATPKGGSNAPSTESPACRGRHQPWCDAAVPDGADRCPRCGVWQLSNRGAYKDGHSSRQLRSYLLESPEAVAALTAHRREIETDLGGCSNLSRVQRDLIGRYVETSVLADWLGGNLVAQGVLTPKGRSRAALSAYLLVLDRQHRLALALGLQRRARPVPSPEQYWQQRATGGGDDAEA